MALVYNIEFRADTKTFQSQFSSVARTMQTELNKAMDLHLGGTLNADLAGAIKGAQVFEQAMLKATTVNGTSFIALNSELRKAGVSAESLIESFAGSRMRESTSKLVETFTFANRQVLTLNGSIQEMGRVLVQSFKFSTAQQFIRFAQSALNDGLRWAQDMDKALTNIEIVTGNTAEGMDRVFDSIVKGSQKLGIAAKEYAEAALIFYQQGLAEDEVGKRTEITIKAAKAAGQNVKEMSEQLTAVWNTYRMQGEQLENAASIAARLGAETAVDFKYIAEAMQTAAVAGAQLGVSYESLVAIIATVGETTMQSASVIGNAYKTIFARLTNLKTSGEDAGESLGRITQSLSDMGIQILESNGELKSVDTIIQNLGNTWDTYSNKQQIAIAQTVGGVRQFTQFLALMQNFDKYQTNLASGMEEQLGLTLGTQFDTWGNSMEAAAGRAKEAWASAFAGLFDSADIKGFYGAVEQAGKVVGQLISGFGGLKGIITIIAALFSKQIAAGMTNMLRMGVDLVKNSTLAGRQLQASTSVQKQINTLETQRTNALSKNQNILAEDLGFTLKKLEAQKKITNNVVALQNIAANGTPQQQAEANAQLALLQTAQNRYNASLDQIQAINDEIDLMDALSQAGRTLTQAENDRLTLLYDQRAALEELSEEQLNQLDIADQSAGDTLDSFGVSVKSVAEGLTGLATGALLAFGGFQQLSSIMSGETEMSFANVLQAVMMLVPGLIAMWGGVMQVAAALGFKTAALTADAIAAKANAIANISAAAAAAGATPPFWALAAAVIAATWPIVAIIAAIALLVAGIAIFIANNEKVIQGHRDAAKAAAESAEANKKTSESLQDLVGDLRDLKNELDAGNISFDEYRQKVAATRQALVDMMKDNPSFRIDLVMFDASSAEKQVQVVEQALLDSNQRIMDNLDAVKEHYKAAGDLTVKSKDLGSDRGAEALEAAASKMSAKVQESLGDSSGWNLDAVAENWQELLSEMSATQQIEFQKMMADVEQFGDIYNTTLAANFAEGQNEFNKALSASAGDPMQMAGFIAKSSLAEQIRSENAEALIALSERQTLLEAERDKAQTAYDLAYEYGYGDITESLENLNAIKEKLSMVDVARDNVLAEVAEAEKDAGMSYDDLQAAIANSGDKQLQQMDAAVKAIASKTGKSYNEIMTAITEGSDKFDKALADSVQKSMKLLAANKANLIGLDQEQTIRVNLALAESSVKDFKTQLASLTDDMDGIGKVEWLETTNEQIKEMNVALATVGMAPVEELTSAFFGLSESSREAYLATLNAAAAEATYASVQGQLAQVLATKSTLIQQLTGDTIASGEEALKVAQNNVDAAAAEMEAKKNQVVIFSESERLIREAQLETAQQQQVLAQQALDAQSAKGKDTSAQEAALAEINTNIDALKADLADNSAQQAALDALNAQYEAAIEVQGRLTEAVNAEKTLEIEGTDALLDTLTDAEKAVYNYDQAVKGLSTGELTNTAAAIEAVKAAWDDLVETTADKAGLDSKDLSGYTEHLQRLTKSTLVNTDALKDNQKLALSVATATMRLNKGIDQLADGFEDWSDVLTKSDQASQEFYEALTGIDEAMSNILNIDTGTLSMDFFTTAENLELMKKAAEGSVEALSGLQLAAATDLLTNMEMFAGFAYDGADAIIGLGDAAQISASQLAQLPGLMDIINNTPVGENLGDDFVNGLNTMLEGMTMTKDAFDAFCSTMGVEVDYETTSVPQEKNGISTKTMTRKVPGEKYKVQTGFNADGSAVYSELEGIATETFTVPGTPYKYTEMVDMVSFATNPSGGGKPNKPVTAGRKVSAPSMSNYSPQNAGGSSTPGKGGGGGGDKKPKDPAKAKKNPKAEKHDPIFERYENINSLLRAQANLLEKIAVATEHAYGTTKQKLHATTIQAMQKEAILQQKLIDEAQAYLKLDQQRAANATANKLGLQVQYNADGGVANLEELKTAYDAYMSGVVNAYNTSMKSATDIWNQSAAGSQDEKVIESADKAYESATEAAEAAKEAALEAFDGESLVSYWAQLDETEEVAKEALKKQVEKIVSWLNEKIVEAVELRNLKMEINARDIEIMDLAMRALGKSAENVGKRLGQINYNMQELRDSSKLALGNYERLMELKDNLNSADQTWFENTWGKEAWAQFKEFGKVPAELMNELVATQDQLMDYVGSLYDEYDKVWEQYISALTEFADQFDTITGKLETNVGILKDLQRIWEASGKQYGAGGRAQTEGIMKAQAATAGQKVESLKAKDDTYRPVAEKAKQDYEEAKRKFNSGEWDELTLEGFKRAYETADSIARQAHADFIGGLAEYLDLIAELEAENAALIYREWSESLNGLFADIDNAMNMYNQKKEIDEYFLTDINKQYELDAIIRKIGDDMKDMTDPEQLEKYQDMLDKLNERKEDGLGITQTNVDIMNQEYELLKAQAALQDAQDAKEAAKNTMRLARDASGNWSYQYSSDDKEATNKVSDMEQKVADLENSIYNLHRKAADEGSEAWLQLQQSYAAYLQEIDWTRYEHDAAYKEQVNQTITWYKEQSALFAEAVTEHNAAIDRAFEDTTLGTITGLETMERAEEVYKGKHTDLKEALVVNHQEWQDKAKETQENVGWDYETLADKANEEIGNIMDDNEELKTDLADLQTTAAGVLGSLQTEIVNTAIVWNTETAKIIADCLEAIKAIQQLRAEEAGSTDALWQSTYDIGQGYNYAGQYGAGYDSQYGANTNISGGFAYGYEQGNEELNALTDKLAAAYDVDPSKVKSFLTGAGGLSYKPEEGGWVKWTDSGYKPPIRSVGENFADWLVNPNYKPMFTGGLVKDKSGPYSLAEKGPEIVLNAGDTENFLEAIQIMRDSIQNHLGALGMQRSRTLAEVEKSHGQNQQDVSQTPVIIQADFPNVTARDEIEAAFSNLVNQAAQYQLKPRG